MREKQEALTEPSVIPLSWGAFADVMSAVSAPGVVVPQLVALFQRKAPWELLSDDTKVVSP
jgi:uncharacterized protein (DUF1778 family)